MECCELKLIVGLGNPGPQYEQTRHNIGFKVIDELAHRLQTPLKHSKFNGMYAIVHHDNEKLILLKPLTYMNLSGESIQAMMRYYDVPIDHLLVIYDDLDLPVGKIRLRQKGSAGGHNGIKSTIAHLGTQEFKRIRVGIDRPGPDISVSNYVLSTFSKEEQKIMEEVISRCADSCEKWLEMSFIEVMNQFN